MVVSGGGYCVGVAVGCGSVSVCCEGADLDEVLSEDAVSAQFSAGCAARCADRRRGDLGTLAQQ
jgi:hypothetical protein